MKDNNVLFLTLKVFSATGGIEKVCRVVGKALYEYGIEKNHSVQVYTMHGHTSAADNNRYFPSEMFRGFGGHKINCIVASVKKGHKSKIVLMSHINLMLIGWLIKKISPSTKIILFAHGIEVWKPLSWFKRMMLNSCDEIISVSNYTNNKMYELHNIPKEKCKVLNNCLDPFLPLPGPDLTNESLRKRYGFSETDIVLFTLTRLSAKERYKGYDRVMEAMVALKSRYPDLRYLLAGSYDKEEKKYLDAIIKKLDLKDQVVMTGFIADGELAAHFSMADIYVMPSIKEGFGIVFIEAMYYGLPAIAGNIDGSVDALCNGEFGLLVDPLSVTAIKDAIELMLNQRVEFIPSREDIISRFGYDNYKQRIETIVNSN